jgi:hypothetical protein
MVKKIARKGKKLDVNQLAKAIVDRATNEEPDEAPPVDPNKNPAAVALGRLGGKKGGLARAAKLSARKRSMIARKAALARWEKARADSPE